MGNVSKEKFLRRGCTNGQQVSEVHSVSLIIKERQTNATMTCHLKAIKLNKVYD
jgi:hypothetical protein